MNRLKEIRESKGMTQTQLGEVIGAKKSAVSLWESGKRQIDNNTLKSLADFFGVSVDYILGRDQEETDQAAITTALLTREERMLEMFRQMDEKEQDAFIKWLEKR